LLLGELDLALGGGLLQPQQALVLGEQVMTPPDPEDTGRGHLDTLDP